MGYLITNDLEKIHPVLSQNGLDWNDYAVLDAIGGRQNDVALARVQAGEISDRSEEGLGSWSWGSAKRIGLEKCISLRTVKRSLATLLSGGYIDSLSAGRHRVYRRINQVKLAAMLAAVPARLEEIKAIMRLSGEMDSLELDQTVIPVDVVEQPDVPLVVAPIQLVAAPMSPSLAKTNSLEFPLAPTAGMSCGEQLAILFFNHMERPNVMNTEGYRGSLINKFSTLLEAGTYSFADLKGSMRWAFEESDYWPEALLKQATPLNFFLKHLEKTILGQYRGVNKSARNKGYGKTTVSTPTIIAFKSVAEIDAAAVAAKAASDAAWYAA